MRNLFVLIALAALAGCASVADSMNRAAGIGVVSSEVSTFDGATIVEASPSWLYSSGSTSLPNRTKLGARWSSMAPDIVTLVLVYDSSTGSYDDIFLGIDSLDVNLAGQIKHFEAGYITALDTGVYNSVSRSTSTSSENTVVIPLALLRDMVGAEDCRIRINTSSGYEDAVFNIDRATAGQATARVSLREMLATISAN